jgi:GT2 family glycosyltransferase
MSRAMTWALVLATYNRAHLLPHCLRLVAQQSWPPIEIIVVDASPDWQQTKQAIIPPLQKANPTITFTYLKAVRASTPAQRNQGIDVASADVVFLFDDDTLMYRDCAGEIMSLYEADKENRVAGIQALLLPKPPHEADATSLSDMRYNGRPDGIYGVSINPLVRLGHRALSAEYYIEVYDSHSKPKQIPTALASMPIAHATTLAGMRMTFRRSVIARVRFDELLEGYAAYEDFDASLRAARLGVLLTALRARVCHLKSSAARLSPRISAHLASLNWAVLLRLNSSDISHAKRAYERKLLKHALVDLVRDIARGRWAVPHFRGRVSAFMMLASIFRRQPDELRSWYRAYQATTLSQWKAAASAPPA